jgi:hypothetical protein
MKIRCSRTGTPFTLHKALAVVTAFALTVVSAHTSAPHAFAGTDLTVTCANNGPCSITPGGTPLFFETNLKPGDTRTQTLNVINQDTDDTCTLTLTTTDTSRKISLNSYFIKSIIESQ